MTTRLFSTPVTAEHIRGAITVERRALGVLPHRLPSWALEQVDDARLTTAEIQPAGVRVVLRTCATVIELDVLPTKFVYIGAPPRPGGVYDLMVDGHLTGQASADHGITVTVDMATGATTTQDGTPATLRWDGLPDYDKEIVIWLPHNESAEILTLRANAPIEPTLDVDRQIWLHHGSSISQGSNAVSPSVTWAALAAAEAGVELINLGFGGSALLDPCVARVIRDTPADLISVKIGINLVNTDLMRLRAFGPAVHGFLDTIRDGHPDTPVLVVSPLLCPIHETTPGPASFDLDALRAGEVRFRATGDPDERAAGKLTLTVIRDELAKIVERRHDPNLHYLDGLNLYGAADFAEMPLPDALHPDTAGHRRIAEHFTSLVFGSAGPFVRADSIQ